MLQHDQDSVALIPSVWRIELGALNLTQEIFSVPLQKKIRNIEALSASSPLNEGILIPLQHGQATQNPIKTAYRTVGDSHL